MYRLSEIKNNYLNEIYGINRIYGNGIYNVTNDYEIKDGMVTEENTQPENKVYIVSSDEQNCIFSYEGKLYKLNVTIGKGEDKARFLPFKNDKCYGVLIPKKITEPCDEQYLLTPSLTGCSIHIIDKGENWLILHDASVVSDNKDNEYTNEKTTRNLCICNEDCVSFEWSICGYRFVKNGQDMKPLGKKMKEGCLIGAHVMFYYDVAEKDWIMLIHHTYGTQSMAGSAVPVSALVSG